MSKEGLHGGRGRLVRHAFNRRETLELASLGRGIRGSRGRAKRRSQAQQSTLVRRQPFYPYGRQLLAECPAWTADALAKNLSKDQRCGLAMPSASAHTDGSGDKK